MVEIEPAFGVELAEPDDERLVVRELEPRRDVRVVVELRHDHLVAGDPVACRSAREVEVERCHVRSEHDLVAGCTEQPGCR